jgi:hypothetical protein
MTRLPQPGNDGGTWGTILNEYLSVVHDGGGNLKPGAVGANTIQDGSIGDSQVTSISQAKVTGLSSALSSKATDTSVVHNTTNETIDGVKTFSASPLVPTPTSGSQATNKDYVDTTLSSGAPDATAGTKGILQLAGDLGGTATTPTVPGLANKVSSNTTIADGTKTKISYDSKGLVTSGTDATQDDIIDGTTNKQYSAIERTKLAGIATGATANDTDANLKNRANHTGTQLASTISDFTEASQDTTGAALTDTSTVDLSYNDADGQITADVKTQMSVTSDASGLRLVGDTVSPGATKYYGTNALGTKGFYDVPLNKTVQVKILGDSTLLTTGDSQFIFVISSDLNGMNLLTANAYVTTVSSSGVPTIQMRNMTNGNVDMLSTPITIDVGELTSYSAISSTVNAANDNVTTGDLLAVDVDISGTNAKGLGVVLIFGAP